MPNRCEYVDPTHNFPCGKNTTLAKIVINSPTEKIPQIKFVCKIHGDVRFNYLSATEIKLTKLKTQNKISYTEFSDKLKKVRWNSCRRCNGDFEKTDIVCCLEYYYLTDIRITLRRSFQLHKDCLESELKLFNVHKVDAMKDSTLDGVLV